MTLRFFPQIYLDFDGFDAALTRQCHVGWISALLSLLLHKRTKLILLSKIENVLYSLTKGIEYHLYTKCIKYTNTKNIKLNQNNTFCIIFACWLLL